ncbi:hypothetical protein [Flexibacterium corallicola]|uniref:hypothetical protein n=1 Tax=Flexibacterium corallicola TaxID=3037259 RepID=UPI00286F0618|nr:hypothetical protein [Pseudovibrio sp. M1P-2-3]
MAKNHVDVAIVGDAVMGSSVAAHLAQHPDFNGSILIFEQDSSYPNFASTLSATSIRHQFSSPINIQISL